MSNTGPESNMAAEVPEAVVEARKGLAVSSVWIVPLVAVFIGAWLVYQALTEKGPTITIAFANAEGLEAGKTKIRYKEVEVGKVTDIALNSDLSGVIVTAEMHKSIEKHLTGATRFWVVRARLSLGGVSGLGTLLSGAYIAMDPGDGEKEVDRFKGLDVPPVLTQDLPGRSFRLRSDSLGSIDVGSPIYYRQLKVGQVTDYRLDPHGRSVDIEFFVSAPYHEFVRVETRFWNASGIDVRFGADGVEVNTASLISILMGGIAFETRSEDLAAPIADDDFQFELHATRERAWEAERTEKRTWLVYFDGSVRGLRAGAPVEFRGIPMGRVAKVDMVFDPGTEEFRIPVLIDLYTDRIGIAEGYDSGAIGRLTQDERARIMNHWVARGFRASLKTGNLLTGQLFVDLNFYTDAPPAEIVWEGKYPELPTVPTVLEQMADRAANIMAKVEAMPLEEIGRNLERATANLDTTLSRVDKAIETFTGELSPTLLQTVQQTEKTLESAQLLLQANAPLQQDLRATLREVNDAARAVRILADYLEQHPESLLRGKEGE